MEQNLIGSQSWRLNNLYYVINENGEKVLFQMRTAQERFFKSLHYYNIVLKARQLGFTTFIDLIALDMVIFRKNFTAVIIAETKEKAADIFEKKVVFPYENLPRELKEWCSVSSHTKTGELRFKNGSMVKVMVSARSGTCQFLHVSEYGPVCAKSPAKAKEILTGSFPAIHAGGFCFVESTAMGNSGYFYDMVQSAKYRGLAEKKLLPQEFKLHFFPWHENPEYVADPESVAIPARLLAYFDDLYYRHGISLSEEQMAWYAVQEAKFHEDMWAEFPSYVDEAFKVAQDGAYYARAFQTVYRENRICAVPYETSLPVYSAWDLGMSDQTSIWFLQFYGKEIRVIDYYENNGEGLGHYASVLREKGYKYARHFAPHDIAVREFSSGISRMDTAKKFGIQFDRIPTNKDVMGGIENCREMLGYCWFDETKTESGRKALEAYKKEWDEKHACYKSQPLHDWASHAADAFRTAAQAWKMGLTSSRISENKIRISGGLKKI